MGRIVRGDHRHQISIKWQGETTGIKFRSNDKGGPQASNFDRSNGKGGPHASNFGQMVRGDHRHQILFKW